MSQITGIPVERMARLMGVEIKATQDRAEDGEVRSEVHAGARADAGRKSPADEGPKTMQVESQPRSSVGKSEPGKDGRCPAPIENQQAAGAGGGGGVKRRGAGP